MSDKITKPFLLDETGKGMSESLALIADALLEMSGGKLTTWAQIRSAVRHNKIGHYLSAGNQLEVESTYLVTAAVSGGITGATVDKDIFISTTSSSAGTHEFIHDGSAWHYNGGTVTLSDYGLTATGTPAEGDAIVITVTATTTDYNVMGIDEDVPANPNITHCLTIQMDNILSNINFDPQQYLYAVTAAEWPSGLPAGTYNITLNHGTYDGSTVEDDTYQFTTTKTVPVGGGIRHTNIGQWQSNSSNYSKSRITSGTFITYSDDTVTVLESGLTCTIGTAGTNLGTATAKDPSYKSGDYINFTQRQIYGSNRWSTSYIRQFLNSDDKVFAFKPMTIWSRNISATPEGFLHSLDTELRAVLCKVRKRYALPIADGYGYEDVEDYVTLETLLDVFGSANNGIYEGSVDQDGNVVRKTAYSFWAENNQAADRIKYRQAGSAYYWWLGSASPSSAGNVRYVSPAGALNYDIAYYSCGAVPSLHIG